MPTHVTDIAERMLGRLLPRWRNGSTMRALVTAQAEEFQAVEDVLYQLYTDRLLEASAGAQLDDYGEIVNLNRIGRGDDEYRAAIKAKVAANKRGHLASVVGYVARVFFASSSGGRYMPLYGAAFKVEVIPAGLLSVDHIAQGVQVLQQMAPAGVLLGEVVSATDNAFRFDTGPGFDVGDLGTRIDI